MNAEEILEQIEKERDDQIAKDANADFKKCQDLADACSERIMQNKIYIVNNKELFNTNIIGKDVSVGRFEELIEDFRQSEDAINFRIGINTKRR